MSEIMVSVVCNTYNHEKYVRQTLEGFVNQKTNFAFEVLIHDDASTDNTPSIIREFEEKYPEIIKPIYQTENKYSKGVDVYKVYQASRISGRYVAPCEGDDYWIDENKLQKQFDLLESNPSIKMCAHSFCIQYDVDDKKEIVHRSESLCVFSPEDVILGGGEFFSTNSLFYKAELDINYSSFRDICPFDYFLQISGSLDNGILYLPDVMSVYRYMASGSWSSRMVKNIKARRDTNNSILDALKQLNEDTNGKYEAAIKKVSFRYGISTYNSVLSNIGFLLSNIKYVKQLSPKYVIKLIIKTLFPSTIRYINNKKISKR